MRTRRKITLRQRLRYAFDRTMARGTVALIGWLAVASALLVLLFSVVVSLADVAPETGGHRPGFLRQLFNSLTHALDPGTIGNEAVGGTAARWAFLLLMLGVTLGGLLIVSALIGVIATGFDRRLMELRKGRSFVVERDHTLILGWSASVFTIVAELAVANASEGAKRSVVILADRDKVAMEDAIHAKVKHRGRLHVIVRSGNPTDLDDLAIVNPGQARSIIVLAEEGEHADAQVIKTVLALTRDPHRAAERYHIVAVIHDPDNLEAARLVGGDETILIDKRISIARLIVQATRQSGAAVVYTELLDFVGHEIYFRDAQDLVGRRFGDALFAYEECAAIGLVRNGSVALNPPSETHIEPGDSLVTIAADEARLAAATPFDGAIDDGAIVLGERRPPQPQHILLLGWNSRATAIVNEMDAYVPAGSKLTVVADFPDAERVLTDHCPGLRNMVVHFRPGRQHERRTLAALGVSGYDHVVVISDSERLDVEQADARTLVTLLHLRDLATDAGTELAIASEMLDDRNRVLAQVTRVDDVIVSDRVISLMVSQIAENPVRRDVFDRLFDADGSEIYLRPAREYVRPGSRTNFATIVEAARRRGETAIGYRVGAEAADPARAYGVRVNVPKSAPIDVADGDRVVVLALA